MTYQSPRFTSESGNRVDANKIKPQLVRKCISSKELGSLAPPSKASFALTLHQRDMLEAEMQQRLQEARQSNLSSDRSLDSKSLDSITSKQDASDSSECSKKRTNRQLKNESRNKRRAEATRAVTGDLCEIVTDLFIAEAKLLNPAIYGIETSLQRDQVYRDVLDFVSELPSRYALGVNTPSEVLLHMRLMAAARSNNSRAVVHLAKLSDKRPRTDDASLSLFLVTISSVDTQGLLEYISKLLASGGSRVLDADVMMSSDNIILDRFVVQMKGRLRLDKLSESIELFLANNLEQRTETIEDSSSPNSSEKVNTEVHASRSPTNFQREAAGPLYFRPPQVISEEPQQNLQEEIDSAVPLSHILSASMSAAALSSAIPMRRSSGSYCGLTRRNSLPPALMHSLGQNENPNSSPLTKSMKKEVSKSGDIGENDDLTDRKQRRLESREAKNFVDPQEDSHERPADFLTVDTTSRNDSYQMMPDERIVPLIAFEELMLIETLGTGRVSTIYRAAWQKVCSPGGSRTLTDVQMVALKVATVHKGSSCTLHVDELRREADIAAMLKHPNVCDLVGVAADAECFCLAYEFCEGGSLLSLLSDTSRYYEYLPIALDIANGMAYLHSRSVIHRDLKPSNVLLMLGRAKVSDFGMSIADCGQELTAETGTYRYMAPEVIRHESYSSNADVYSFGILLWQLITREIPFATMTPIQAAFSVAEGLRPEIPDTTPSRLREIIVSCWNHDAHKRPSFTYVAMALADYARMAFSPANVGAQTLQIANEMLATVEGNSNINVDFSTPVARGYGEDRYLANNSNHSCDVGLENS
eukprot:CAMPEP_0178901634 /NCGR_PEP_ID=MMETSP0786-20121207/4144_1 /TAXON_ID=186022 /ORGANISM="Thalassionema frauenfeldii, Strain CCMP 1798" /LENGTH=815 /DNA_ID=CAMNT_0020572783 /DNA_START=823 /DNA_END=3268 /DNA_ORIENTATION=-